jgi:hypothetical protein
MTKKNIVTTIYRPTKKALNELFKFSVNYFKDPTKKLEGRTSGEPRGLGSIIDSFMFGKLMEYAFKGLIEKQNSDLTVGLDFTTSGRSKDADSDPDLVSVTEKGKTRKPNKHVEVKATTPNQRWITLPARQLVTNMGGGGKSNFYSAYLSVHSDPKNSNERTGDPFGVWMKYTLTNNTVLDEFQDVSDLKCNLEFVLRGEDIEKFCYHAMTDDEIPIYEVYLLKKRKLPQKSDGTLYKGWSKKATLSRKRTLRLYDEMDGSEVKNSFGFFKWQKGGKIEVYQRQFTNQKGEASSTSTVIVPSNNITLINEYIGTFKLRKNQPYDAKMKTLNKRSKEEYLISKKRILELIDESLLINASTGLEEIAKKL